jgi:hypothetical protein
MSDADSELVENYRRVRRLLFLLFLQPDLQDQADQAFQDHQVDLLDLSDQDHRVDRRFRFGQEVQGNLWVQGVREDRGRPCRPAVQV